MYISNTDMKVVELFSCIEELNDLSKLKFLIYVFVEVNNNQINDKNEANPDLLLDDDLKVFKFSYIGLSDNCCEIFIEYLVMLYNVMSEDRIAYIDSNVVGLTFNEEETKIISMFERLSFENKLDVFGEIFIRYDNETYFNNEITMLTFDSKLSGYDIARNVLMFKESD